MKPGWQTSEFWVALVPIVGAVALSVSRAVDAVTPYLSQPMGWETVALMASALAAAFGYGQQRAAAKKTEQKLRGPR